MYPNYVNCGWTKDSNWNDAEYKNKFLESLSEEQKEALAKRIKEDPRLGDYLGIDIEE